MKRTMTTLTVTAALLLPLLLLAVWLGGPRPVARMDSIHQPFARADFSGFGISNCKTCSILHPIYRCD